MPSLTLRKPPLARRIAVIVAVAAAILFPAAQAFFDLGISQAEFADDGNETLRAATYAFSIWTLIYLGLAAYAIYQARSRESAALAAFGWPSVISIGTCALWIVASGMDLKAASIAIIVVGAAAAILPLLRRPALGSMTERALVQWPNALLAGWLTIAAALNVLTVLTAWDVIVAESARAWALAAVAVVVVTALVVAQRARSAVYLLPIVWGLIAVYVAERAGDALAARIALASAAVLGAATLVMAIKDRSATR